jgi:hypothetical protein
LTCDYLIVKILFGLHKNIDSFQIHNAPYFFIRRGRFLFYFLVIFHHGSIQYEKDGENKLMNVDLMVNL